MCVLYKMGYYILAIIYIYIGYYIYIYILYNGLLYNITVIESNEVMSFVATWMDLDIIMLSEANQREKDKYHTISLVSGI